MSADIVETHSAVIALVEDRAYKTKKAVDLGFLDFRSAAAREHAILRELRLNQRLAPDVYLDAARLVGSGGDVLDHVLIMRRMPEDRRLSTLLEQHLLSPHEQRDQLRRIARVLADFHARAERGALISAEAGLRGLRQRWQNNVDELMPFAGGSVPRELLVRIAGLATEYLAGREALFDRRGAAGVYVDGHGDLTAEDIFCLDDGPRLLDCLDFDDRLRWVDALDDAAFLAMELDHLRRPELARYFLDRYAEFSATPSVPSLEHHYIAYRALVRAKIACLRAEQQLPAAGVDPQRPIDEYLEMSLRHLEAGQVRLILVGGAPGTGKTTVAGQLADLLGAVLLSTDSVRRDLHPDEPAGYDDRSREEVYRLLLCRARRALSNGESVVADATWGAEHLRADARASAKATHSSLVELECHAPPGLAAARADRRRREGTSDSEAGGHVAQLLLAHRDAWPAATPVDCSGSSHEALRGIADVIAFPAASAGGQPR